MTREERAYVLDSNVFIEAKNAYYAFALCPGFWNSLLGHYESGNLCSIDHVKRELLVGRDDLARWIKRSVPVTFFDPTTDTTVTAQYREISTWVQSNPQFVDLAKAEYAASADGWLVAYAKAKGHVVVTHEQLRAEARNRVPIPNVCEQFGVAYTDTFQMLKALGVQFTWTATD